MFYKSIHLDQSYPEDSHGSNWYSTTKEKKVDVNLAKMCTRCDVRYLKKKKEHSHTEHSDHNSHPLKLHFKNAIYKKGWTEILFCSFLGKDEAQRLKYVTQQYSRPSNETQMLCSVNLLFNLFKSFWAGPSAVLNADKGYVNIKSPPASLCKPQMPMTSPYLLLGPSQTPWSSGRS